MYVLLYLRACLLKNGNTFSLQLPPCVFAFIAKLVREMPQNCVSSLISILWKSKSQFEKFKDHHVRFWTIVFSAADEPNSNKIIKQVCRGKFFLFLIFLKCFFGKNHSIFEI